MSASERITALSALLGIVKYLILLLVFIVVFLQSDLYKTYLLSEKVELIKSLPTISMPPPKYHLFCFHINSPDPITVSKTTLLFEGNGKQGELEIRDSESIPKTRLDAIIEKFGNLEEPGQQKIKVRVKFETNFGLIGGDINPYILRYKVTSRGNYESPVFFRDGVFSFTSF